MQVFPIILPCSSLKYLHQKSIFIVIYAVAIALLSFMKHFQIMVSVLKQDVFWEWNSLIKENPIKLSISKHLTVRMVITHLKEKVYAKHFYFHHSLFRVSVQVLPMHA